MDGMYPVGDIYWRSNSGSGDEDRSKFVQYVDGREPEVHKICTFGEDGVTPKVHTTAQVDVSAGFVSEFSTNYLTEDGRRIPMFGRKSINGSVEWLGVTAPLRTNGIPWNDNILVPSPDLGAGGTATKSNW